MSNSNFRTLQANYIDGLDVTRNYISNGSGNKGNTSGWSTYADAAGTQPVDGTGGSPSVTIATSSSSPLSGDYSFLLAKGASNLQGNGWSYDFTIDSSDQAKVMAVSFDYLISSGTFVAGTSSADSDVTLWLYDVTNSVLISPTATRLYSNSSTVGSKLVSNFQTSYNSTSYRLILHVGSTSASAYTLKIDNVCITSSAYVYGTPITDWTTNQAPAPASFQGFGTPTVNHYLWRRAGDSIEIMGKFTVGTASAVEARVPLPIGFTSADTSKIPSIQMVGTHNENSFNSVYFGTGAMLIEPSVTYMTMSINASTQSGVTKINGTSIGSSVVVSFFATVPIQGLSSTVQTSDSADQRLCVASMSGAGSSAASAAVITLPTIDFDTHGAITSGQFKAPTSGYYEISVHLQASASIAYATYLNGVLQKRFCISDAAGGDASGSHVLKVSAGDLLDVRPTATSGAFNANSFIQFAKVTGPSAIGATETISASYYTSANCTATTAINFDTKLHDTHGAVTASTAGTGSWRFTAPSRGLYRISGTLAMTVGLNSNIALVKNGSTYIGQIGYITNNNGVGSYVSEVFLNAGDFIWIATGSGTAAGGVLTGGAACNIAITRVGI